MRASEIKMFRLPLDDCLFSLCRNFRVLKTSVCEKLLHCYVAGSSVVDSAHTQQHEHTKDRRFWECIWTPVWYYTWRRQLWWRWDLHTMYH